jgi:hypothetical protein
MRDLLSASQLKKIPGQHLFTGCAVINIIWNSMLSWARLLLVAPVIRTLNLGGKNKFAGHKKEEIN